MPCHKQHTLESCHSQDITGILHKPRSQKEQPCSHHHHPPPCHCLVRRCAKGHTTAAPSAACQEAWSRCTCSGQQGIVQPFLAHTRSCCPPSVTPCFTRSIPPDNPAVTGLNSGQAKIPQAEYQPRPRSRLLLPALVTAHGVRAEGPGAQGGHGPQAETVIALDKAGCPHVVKAHALHEASALAVVPVAGHKLPVGGPGADSLRRGTCRHWWQQQQQAWQAGWSALVVGMVGSVACWGIV